jgi:hypothetical protein
MHTYLEVNTVLTKPVGVLKDGAVIGRDTVLGDREPCASADIHGRIGTDFIVM